MFAEEHSRAQLVKEFAKIEKYFEKRWPNTFNYFEMDVTVNEELFKTFNLQGPGFALYKNG